MLRFTILFFCIMFMIGTDTFLVSPLLPTLQDQFGVDTGIAGWMIGAYTLGSAIFALIAGPLSDGWNRRFVLVSGLLGFAVSTILCGFAFSFWSMCLFRFLAGISAAFTAPQVWASIPAVMPASKISKAMGVAFSGLAAAQALGVPIGSWLAASSWSVPFWIIGGVALLLAAAAYGMLPNIHPHEPQRNTVSIFRRYMPLITSGKARSGYLAYLLLHLGSGTTMAFVGKWLADRFELPVESIGTVMLFLGFGSLLGSFISSAVVKKLGQASAVAVGTALLVLFYTGSPHMANLPVVTALYLIIFTTLGIIFPLVMEALTSLNASIRGTISSLANSTMNVANTLGAWAAGILYTQFGGFDAIGMFSAVSLALSLGIFLFGGVLQRKSEHAGQESPSAS